MRTRLSVCGKKVRYVWREEATVVALANPTFRVYLCDRCRHSSPDQPHQGKWGTGAWRD